jgi:protein-S-isoprenylcysteine O-methyltransferase Ste14
MSRPLLALSLIVLFYAVVFGLRTWRHLRTTGSTGFHGISGRPGSAEWLGGVLFVVGVALGFLAPLGELRGWLAPLWQPGPWGVAAGVAVTLAGIASTYAAQVSMGSSWRIGVREDERTQLVVGGAFTVVRNPIFSCMLLTATGLLLLLPNALSVAALASLLAAVELQVRVVEEPYLLRTHGQRYRDYARRVGRFVPGLGRLG